MKTSENEAVSYVTPTPEGGWRIAGTRVLLECVVYAYLEGETPEAIVKAYPTLALEQVHGAIAFYLRYRDEMDEYLRALDAKWQQLRETSEEANRELLDRVRAQREASGS